jgi:hypothetical protein
MYVRNRCGRALRAVPCLIAHACDVGRWDCVCVCVCVCVCACVCVRACVR